MMDIQLTSVEAAMKFLCKRNPFDEIEHTHWVFMLLEFQEKKGDEALEALAGAYIWAIDNKKGDEQHACIMEVFVHDIGERHDEFSLPRSSSYKPIWDKEFLSWQ